MTTLPDLLSADELDIYEISEYFDTLLAEAVVVVNAEFGPKRLSKRPRQDEPLPTDKRQLSSYRTRIGTMLEYAISTEMTKLLDTRYGSDKYLVTFATAHEYPDFYFRDNTLSSLLRIEMKAVDAESDEQAARFSTPTAWIDNDRDLLLLVGWEWTDLARNDEVIGEYPHIFASLIVPAGEIAKERDKRLAITGGKIEGENVFVYSKRKEKFVSDPGNYGKFWRIIHTSRQTDELSEVLLKFMKFLEKVDQHSPRDRFRKRKRKPKS